VQGLHKAITRLLPTMDVSMHKLNIAVSNYGAQAAHSLERWRFGTSSKLHALHSIGLDIAPSAALQGSINRTGTVNLRKPI